MEEWKRRTKEKRGIATQWVNSAEAGCECRGEANVSIAVFNHCDLRASVFVRCQQRTSNVVCDGRRNLSLSHAQLGFLIMMMLMISGRFIFLLPHIRVLPHSFATIFSRLFVSHRRRWRRCRRHRWRRARESKNCIESCVRACVCVCVTVSVANWWCVPFYFSFFFFSFLRFGFFNVLGLGCRLLLFLVWRTADSLGMLWLAFASKESSPSSVSRFAVHIDCDWKQYIIRFYWTLNLDIGKIVVSRFGRK